MHRDRRDTTIKGTVEDGEELLLTLSGVVDAPPHLQRDRQLGGDCVADSANDLKGCLGHAQQIAAPAASQHLLDRAAEVDVDAVEAGFDKATGGRSEVIGVGPHQLATDRVLFSGDCQPGQIAAVGADLSKELVEHHLAEGVGSAKPTGHDPHWQVTVAGEGCLHDL